MPAKAPSRVDNVRIGPISIITLITVICMAVLSVLAISTATATLAITERQVAATTEMYSNERVGQEFVASVDEVLASVRTTAPASGLMLVDNSLDSICTAAQAVGDEDTTVTAIVEGTTVNAEIVGEKMRKLNIAITILDDATYRIDGWKAAAVQNEVPTAGTLWSGA